MGSQQSSEDAQPTFSGGNIDVALMGLSDTGKSHFLGTIGGPEYAQQRPTNGTETLPLRYRGRLIRLTEFGGCRSESWAHLMQVTRYSCIIWFIDSHDSLEDILTARNRIHDACMRPQLILSKMPALCIVHNMGRPHSIRRNVEAAMHTMEWAEHRTTRDAGGAIVWADLPAVVDLAYLEKVHGPVYLTQLSYQDLEVPVFLLNWVLETCRNGTRP